MVAAANKSAPALLLAACFLQVAVGSVRLGANRGGRSGGDDRGVAFVPWLRRYGDECSGVTAGPWALYRSGLAEAGGGEHDYGGAGWGLLQVWEEDGWRFRRGRVRRREWPGRARSSSTIRLLAVGDFCGRQQCWSAGKDDDHKL